MMVSGCHHKFSFVRLSRPKPSEVAVRNTMFQTLSKISTYELKNAIDVLDKKMEICREEEYETHNNVRSTILLILGKRGEYSLR
jgi:hypothetical protein